MQFHPLQLPTSAQRAGPPGRFPNRGGPALNIPPPVLHFPQTGVTPPHPHPVAPFPPPPRSYATIRHGPVSPAPLSLHGNLQQPFYSLAFTHLPPHARPGPLPHPVPISLYPSSSSVHPSPPATQGARQLPSTLPSSPATRMPLSVPPVGQTISVPLSCKHCGHYMVANLSAGQGQMLNYRIPPTPPTPPPPPPSLPPPPPPSPLLPPPSPLSPTSAASSSRPHVLAAQFLRYNPVPQPQPSHPLQLATPQSLVLHYPGSQAAQITPQPAVHGLRFEARETQPRSSTTSTLRRSTSTVHSGISGGGDGIKNCRGVLTNPRIPRKKGFASSKGHEVIPQPSSRIIPYRERKKRTSVEVHARQQLELEFAHLPKPTQAQIAELAAKLGVSKDFVRVWFSNRRQKQKHQETVSGKVGTTIPSLTHDITVEVGAAATEGIPNATVFVFTTRQ